jgi:hypothetical protein
MPGLQPPLFDPLARTDAMMDQPKPPTVTQEGCANCGLPYTEHRRAFAGSIAWCPGTVVGATYRPTALATPTEPKPPVSSETTEQIISAWAFAHNIDGAARNDLFKRLRDAAPSSTPVSSEVAKMAERLRRNRQVYNGMGTFRDERVNPDGPAAADMLEKLSRDRSGVLEEAAETNARLVADLAKFDADISCEGCGAPLFEGDDYVSDPNDIHGCWAALTDRPSKRERPCYAYRVGKPSACQPIRALSPTAEGNRT